MTLQDSDRLTVPPDGRPDSEQPRWRQDFPIDWPQDDYITRRDFAKFMVLVSLAFTAGQFWILVQNFFRRQQGALPIRPIIRLDEVPVGGSLVFQYPQEQNNARILVRLSEESFVAYDQQCTHLLCPVIAEPEAGRLHCPCHDGNFDLATGQPVSGPPRRPLPRITLEVRGDTIYATGIEEGVG
jgi:nitrite reductase/ring-hydroxylating ferredoxin subunit